MPSCGPASSFTTSKVMRACGRARAQMEAAHEDDSGELGGVASVLQDAFGISPTECPLQARQQVAGTAGRAGMKACCCCGGLRACI